MSIKTICIVLCASMAYSAMAQDPWPMDRQDRWGTGRQTMVPADPGTPSTPWIFANLAPSGLCSNGPALTAGGDGYYGAWFEPRFVKFSMQTGFVLNTFDTLKRCQSSPAIGLDGEVYICTNEHGQQAGRLFRINPTSFDYDWSFITGSEWFSDWDTCSPTIGPDGHIVLGGTGGQVWKIDRITGQPVWTNNPGRVMHTAVFTRDDSKVIVSGATSVRAYNYETGALEWTFSPMSTVGGPGVAPNGTIVVGTHAGNVHGLNPATGAVIWTYSTLAQVHAPPAFSLDGSVAYICGYDKRLYALRVSDGVRLWSYTTVDECYEPPSVGYDGRIYFGTRNGWLYCVAPNGALVWSVACNWDIRGSISIDGENNLFVPNGYLRYIRQRETAYDIQYAGVERGEFIKGGFEQLAASDDLPLVIQTLGQGRYPDGVVLRAEFQTTAQFAEPNKFKFLIESKVDQARVTQVVELFNIVTGKWDVISKRATALSDSEVIVNVTVNAIRYQTTAGMIRARVSYQMPKYVVPVPSFRASIDRMGFVGVVPRFRP